MSGVFIVAIAILLGTTDVLASHQQGVVNSSIAVPCDILEGFDTETVRWFVNSSTKPFLSYFPKDNSVLPPDHDPRYLITDIETLYISHLRKSDAGEYICRVTSTLPIEDVQSVVNVTVLDGCVMWVYSPPLMATSSECSSDQLVGYAQQCNFTCDHGYALTGDAFIQCQGNGQLSNVRPICEEVSCTIGNFSSHLIDKNKACVAGAQVPYGTVCDFECTTGYSIMGNATTLVSCGDDGVYPVFPQCDEESASQNLWYISLIVIFAVVIGIGMGVFVRRTRKQNKKSTDGAEVRRNSYSLVEIDEPKTGLDDRTTDDKDTVLITTYEGFMDLLRERIGERYTAIIKVLQTLQQAELKHMPMLSKMQFCEHKALAKESVFDVFVWYVAEIVRCIDQLHPRLALDLTSDIILSAEDITSGGSNKTASVFSFEQEDDNGTNRTKSYLEVVHSAFIDLFVALRQNIKDTDVVNERTTNITQMIKRYYRDKNKDIEEEGDHVLLPKQSTPSNWAASNEGTDFFAKMCVQYINKCLTLKDRIELRYEIFNAMIESPD